MIANEPIDIGHSINVETEVLDKRPTQQPDRGIVAFFHRVRIQDGQAVMENTVKRMIRRRV